MGWRIFGWRITSGVRSRRRAESIRSWKEVEAVGEAETAWVLIGMGADILKVFWGKESVCLAATILRGFYRNGKYFRSLKFTAVRSAGDSISPLTTTAPWVFTSLITALVMSRALQTLCHP